MISTIYLFVCKIVMAAPAVKKEMQFLLESLFLKCIPKSLMQEVFVLTFKYIKIYRLCYNYKLNLE